MSDISKNDSPKWFPSSARCERWRGSGLAALTTVYQMELGGTFFVPIFDLYLLVGISCTHHR